MVLTIVRGAPFPPPQKKKTLGNMYNNVGTMGKRRLSLVAVGQPTVAIIYNYVTCCLPGLANNKLYMLFLIIYETVYHNLKA